MHIPSPKELKEILPLSANQSKFISSKRSIARDVLLGRDKRMVIVAGPCSIHDLSAAKEYAQRFKELSQKVKNSCLLIMRVYFEKARTCMGWKGFLYDPHLNGSNDIQAGLYLARKLLLELADMHIPAATEFVDPLLTPYIEDLICWGFIGARTCASQPHRQLASHLSLPIGFKNSTDGNLDDAINGVLSARAPHSFLHVDEDGRLSAIESQGNALTHIVLRGSNELPNYDPKSVNAAVEKLALAHLTPRLLIDCSHGNCQKQFIKQKEAFSSVVQQMQDNEKIMGVMLESHLEKGNQLLSEEPSSLRYAVSITDPCIDWTTTEELILSAHSALDIVPSSSSSFSYC
ncbi:MAG TPA: 3-deoxy-7-phosphoheptulonate synthase [Rhabdochlamydiaceae bacterium]|nr:3-deoxy-7-phosphoheptulonate synthase [Rhabdochlamydiaceae bacterium]